MNCLLTFLLLLTDVVATAQVGHTPPSTYLRGVPDKLIELPAVLLLASLAVWLPLRLLQLVLDHRLRVQMIERGLPEEAIRQLLATNPKERQAAALKWCLLLAGGALGFCLATLVTPGLPMLATVATTLSLAFLAYFFLLRRLR